MALILPSLLALTHPVASSADPYVDEAAVVVCPAPPSRFELPPGEQGRFVLSPLSDLAENPGGTSIQVSCKYFTHSGELLLVAARYALKSNFNPYWDFFIGCKTNKMGIGGPTGPKPWNTKDRIYRVISEKSWSFASFADPYHVVRDNEVEAFEAITRSMLKGAEKVAHDCTLSKDAVALQKFWLFAFDVAVKKDGLTTSGGSRGSFVTEPDLAGGTGRLGALKADDIVLRISKGSKAVGRVTLHITEPLSFRYGYEFTLRARVKVSASTYTPCRTGTTGILTVSSDSDLLSLEACDRSLLQGTGRTSSNLTQ